MSVERCADCNATLGTLRQTNLPGIAAPKYCITCTTKRRARLMLTACPDENDPMWASLSEFEQQFLPSVREQFARKGSMSEKQYQILERIYAKV
jgi:hypothetical protein